MRLALARKALDRAYRAIEADAAAGRISWGHAAVKYAALRAAYERRREAIRFAGFLAANGLSDIVRTA